MISTLNICSASLFHSQRICATLFKKKMSSSKNFSKRLSDSDLMPPPPRPPAPTSSQTSRNVAQTPSRASSSEDGSDAESAVPFTRSAPPAPTTNQEILNDLRLCLQPQSSTHNSFCGGSVPIQGSPPPLGSETVQQRPASTRGAFTLRFDKLDGSVSKVQFPHTKDLNASFQQLFQACSPSESGTDARELNATRFSLNFHPADFGIVDTIAQLLLPGIKKHATRHDKTQGIIRRVDHWGVRAESGSLVVSFALRAVKCHVAAD